MTVNRVSTPQVAPATTTAVTVVRCAVTRATVAVVKIAASLRLWITQASRSALRTSSNPRKRTTAGVPIRSRK
ncbi:hypothetical protein D3C79_940170 [compost metagenome]